MAGEIQYGHPTAGNTLYAVVTTPVGTWLNGTTAEAYNASNWTSYAIALTEFGASALYRGTFPVVAAGAYYVHVRERLGGAAAVTDPVVGGPATVYWSGTAIMTLADVVLATPAEAAGRPSSLNGMIRRLFEGRHNKRTRDRATGNYVIRNAADSADLETQVQATAGTLDSQTKGV